MTENEVAELTQGLTSCSSSFASLREKRSLAIAMLGIPEEDISIAVTCMPGHSVSSTPALPQENSQ